MDLTIIERAGLTRTEFSAIVGVSRSALHAYLGGRAKPNPLTMKRLARVTEVLEYFINVGLLPMKLQQRTIRKRLIEKLVSHVDSNHAYK